MIINPYWCFFTYDNLVHYGLMSEQIDVLNLL